MLLFSLTLALWQGGQLNGLTPWHDLHEREVAKLLFVSRYSPLALLDHVLDRLEDAWVRLTDFLDLCVHKSNPKRAAIGQSVRSLHECDGGTGAGRAVG